MQVIGPNWTSTRSLQSALADVESSKTLSWGVNTCRGYAQLKQLYTNSIPVPAYTSTLEYALRWLVEGKIVLGRKNSHTQGRDIISARPRLPIPSRWKQRDFWSIYTPLKEEFRVHVFNGQVLRVGSKIQCEPELSSLNSTGVEIRSRRCGWKIWYTRRARLTDDLEQEMSQLAIHAVAALEYLSGAVDIGFISGSNFSPLIVLEVNSAPALRDEKTLAAYVTAIRAWA